LRVAGLGAARSGVMRVERRRRILAECIFGGLALVVGGFEVVVMDGWW
jgi:hypothetical protein